MFIISSIKKQRDLKILKPATSFPVLAKHKEHEGNCIKSYHKQIAQQIIKNLFFFDKIILLHFVFNRIHGDWGKIINNIIGSVLLAQRSFRFFFSVRYSKSCNYRYTLEILQVILFPQKSQS